MPADHVKTVCKIGQGAACCRYLTVGANGFECEKHSSLGKILDARVLVGAMTSRGNNCKGIKGGFAPQQPHTLPDLSPVADMTMAQLLAELSAHGYTTEDVAQIKNWTQAAEIVEGLRRN